MIRTQTTIGVRVDQNLRKSLEEISKTAGFVNLSEFLRALLTEYAASYPQKNSYVNASQTQEQQPLNDNVCPILRIFATIRCTRCIFKKQTEDKKAISEVFSRK